MNLFTQAKQWFRQLFKTSDQVEKVEQPASAVFSIVEALKKLPSPSTSDRIKELETYLQNTTETEPWYVIHIKKEELARLVAERDQKKNEAAKQEGYRQQREKEDQAYGLSGGRSTSHQQNLASFYAGLDSGERARAIHEEGAVKTENSNVGW